MYDEEKMINSGKNVLNVRKLGEIHYVYTITHVKLRKGLMGVISIQMAIKTMTKKHNETETNLKETNSYSECKGRNNT